MAEYYLPDGTGPFYVDADGVIPDGSNVVATAIAGSTGTEIDGLVVTALQYSGTTLQYKTRAFTNGIINGTESAWTNVPTV